MLTSVTLADGVLKRQYRTILKFRLRFICFRDLFRKVVGLRGNYCFNRRSSESSVNEKNRVFKLIYPLTFLVVKFTSVRIDRGSRNVIVNVNL